MSFSVPEGTDPRYTRSGALHVPRNAGEQRWFSGDLYTIKAHADMGSGSLGLMEAIVPPGRGPVAHLHNNADEAFYLLSGELEILDGARTFVAEPGDLVVVPRGTRHRFKNIGYQTAKMLVIITPGGTEETFRRYGDAAVPGEQPPPWGVERYTEEIMEHLRHVGDELLPETD